MMLLTHVKLLGMPFKCHCMRITCSHMHIMCLQGVSWQTDIVNSWPGLYNTAFLVIFCRSLSTGIILTTLLSVLSTLLSCMHTLRLSLYTHLYSSALSGVSKGTYTCLLLHLMDSFYCHFLILLPVCFINLPVCLPIFHESSCKLSTLGFLLRFSEAFKMFTHLYLPEFTIFADYRVALYVKSIGSMLILKINPVNHLKHCSDLWS